MDPDARRELKKFIHDHVERVKALTRKGSLAWWGLHTTGEEKWQQKSAEFSEKIKRIYADRHDFRQVAEWIRESDGIDPILMRQMEILQLRYLEHQTDHVTIREMVEIQTELEAKSATHRGTIRGEPVAANRIDEILKDSMDVHLRREAWEASKSVGPVVRRDLLRLVHLRNRAAQRLGFRDHYELALKVQEIDEKGLLDILDALEMRTGEPYRREKSALDAVLADRFGVETHELRPWHYSDAFFQEAPPDPALKLDRFFEETDLSLLTERTFRICGLSVEDVLARSDLEERDGKTQHAFCLCVDREQKDIRVLSNNRPDERWAATMLHEFGHAVYDKYQDVDMPWLLMQPAHEAMTEAVAMLFGRLTRDPRWLKRVGRVDAEVVDGLADRIAARQRLGMLVFVRWALVMVRFERQLYRDPEQDLDRLWWELVQRIQGITPPEGRWAPDWAAKIHFAVAPVYYHNYLLGELIASQLQSHIETRLDGEEAVPKSETGDFLVQGVFRPGRTMSWEETLRAATGEALNPEYFVRQFVDTDTVP